MENDNKFSIELARKKAGLTQEEISEALGMSRNQYREYEKGKIVFRMDTAWRFSEIVGLSIDSIIFFNANYTSSVV